MALVWFYDEPVSLDVNKVYFEEEQGSKKSRKGQSVIEWCRCGRRGIMHTYVKYLSCDEVEALGDFQLSDIRNDTYHRSPKELVQQSCNFT